MTDGTRNLLLFLGALLLLVWRGGYGKAGTAATPHAFTPGLPLESSSAPFRPWSLASTTTTPSLVAKPSTCLAVRNGVCVQRIGEPDDHNGNIPLPPLGNPIEQISQEEAALRWRNISLHYGSSPEGRTLLFLCRDHYCSGGFCYPVSHDYCGPVL